MNNIFLAIYNLAVLFGVLLMAIMAGLWWTFDDGKLSEGVVFLVGTWVLAFNFLPVQGLKCLKEPVVKFYYLPLAILGLIGFIYGVVQH
ncbi:hypothetical protein ACJJIW_20770 [Microbulbifer sp. JMSA004]|uniref:hypothetical protein n=1 Tax=unclassified Microbulbifer TaxID=2619833 RepID=UPI0024AD7221|nr:hypothetical protein [Microbulbifer sp. VAAF005]WHI46436.1 hypothetical protein P0078_22445 [Microbulbifer sp. VAAF005]